MVLHAAKCGWHSALVHLINCSGWLSNDQYSCNVHTGAFVLVSNRLKTLDPYHVVIGAIESIDMFVFTSKNVFVPEASLDVPMLENYVGYVAQNAAQGTAFGQVSNINASFSCGRFSVDQ